MHKKLLIGLMSMNDRRFLIRTYKTCKNGMVLTQLVVN